MTKPDLRPLFSGTPGDRLLIDGVHVGEPAEGIAIEKITSADGPADEPRQYRDGEVWRKIGEEWVEIPLAEMVAQVLRVGGLLRTEAGAFAVEGGRVAGVFLRGEWLEEVFGSEGDIVARLGPPEGRHRAGGRHYYHYPSRALVVAWASGDDRIDYVALGPDEWREARLGARDLLRELLLDDGLEPAEGSARVRRARIEALASALGLGSSQDVLAGRFLSGELSPGRREVLVEIARRGPEAERTPRDFYAGMLYRSLLDFRHRVHAVQTATAGWLESNDAALAGMITTQNTIGARLGEDCTYLDDWLCRLLDPESRLFSNTQLVTDFGYPDVDLEDLERRELWGTD